MLEGTVVVVASTVLGLIRWPFLDGNHVKRIVGSVHLVQDKPAFVTAIDT